MKKIHITAYPYVIQKTKTKIPDNIKDTKRYIKNNIRKIKFNKTEIYYENIKFDYEEEPF